MNDVATGVCHPETPAAAVPGFGDFGAYFGQRKRKLSEQAEQRAACAPKCEQIFAGVVFHINGYTQPSHYELKLLLIDRGGRFLHYLSKTKVTHIITSGLTMSKEKELRNYKVVRPEWVVDSVRARRMLSWQKYSLFGTSTAGISARPPLAIGDFDDWGDLGDNEPPPKDASSHRSLETYQKPPPAPPIDTYAAASTRRAPHGLPARPAIIDRFGEGLNRAWVRKNLATDKDFIARYYSSSRLHQMSAWKAEMKDYVAQVRRKRATTRGPSDGDPSGRVAEDCRRVIMHVDFDCFFVSASLLSHSQLAGGPVAVCHEQQQNHLGADESGETGRHGGTSQIASCNYLARSFGVRNGMFMAQASQLCPSLVTVPYNFDMYKRISKRFYEIVADIADKTQAVSIDEALLDVSQVVHRQYHGRAEDLAQHIRHRVLEDTQCTVSVGIGPSILLARVATAKAKPNGIRQLGTDEFVGMDLAARDLPGIGHVVEESLAGHGIRRTADIRATSMDTLRSICGEAMAATLYKFSRGDDDRNIEPDKPRKVFGAEIGWGVRLSNQSEADDFVTCLAEEVCRSMDAARRIGGAATLKVKKRQEGQGKPGKFLGHGICDSLSKSASLPRMTNELSIVAPACVKLLHAMKIDPLDIRAVGIQVSNLEFLGSRTNVSDLLVKSKALDKTLHPNSKKQDCNMLHFGLPSASQLDVNVLNELPESIQHEIQAAYQHISPGVNIGQRFSDSAESGLPEAKANSASVSAARQPGRGNAATKRGRARKLVFPAARPSERVEQASLVQAFRKVESLDSVIPSQMDSDVWGHLPLNIRRELAREYLKNNPSKPGAACDNTTNTLLHRDRGMSGSEQSSAVESNSARVVKASAPSLGGKHTVADIRQLIETWVGSSDSGPLKDDVAEFGDFVEATVKHRNLVKAEDALRYFKHCTDGKHCAWKDALEAVLGRANMACEVMYSARLYI
ncbi:deoxycytidyl transferase [Coemansia sp. RSA 2322]|nr:deoxycytidyl transferase [Coemansia sp. RSA 2322]